MRDKSKCVVNETEENENLDENIFYDKIILNHVNELTKKSGMRKKFDDFVVASKYYEDNIEKNKIFIGNFITPIPMKAVNMIIDDVTREFKCNKLKMIGKLSSLKLTMTVGQLNS